ncbi:Xanthocillin biosynthesis cluster protein D [Cladobotryum mycophilum]|uniref:Xanthocillin biosynthesis cluster protein D n=1 Tax=Cladobotryum mycophilum TaxID=491253 RepID=A0ABR0SE96_9HYPO
MVGSSFTSVVPYHILSYGTLLGTTFFHSFINGPVMYKTVTRPSFSAIQTGLFPIYFGIQTALPAILALTFPGSPSTPSGIYGILDESHRWGSLVPIATMLVTGVVNLVVLLPVTVKTMKERRGQAKRDGKEWYDNGPHSDEMRALTKKFGMLHGISSLLNLGTFFAAITYGFTLASRIQ